MCGGGGGGEGGGAVITNDWCVIGDHDLIFKVRVALCFYQNFVSKRWPNLIYCIIVTGIHVIRFL